MSSVSCTFSILQRYGIRTTNKYSRLQLENVSQATDDRAPIGQVLIEMLVTVGWPRERVCFLRLFHLFQDANNFKPQLAVLRPHLDSLVLLRYLNRRRARRLSSWHLLLVPTSAPSLVLVLHGLALLLKTQEATYLRLRSLVVPPSNVQKSGLSRLLPPARCLELRQADR